MNKIIVGLVLAVIIVAGGYLVFHKSFKPAATATSKTSSTLAVNNAILVTKSNASLGQYLTDVNGKPLYTYGADVSGVSNCTGPCLTEWPAYRVMGATTNLPTGVSTIKRKDNGQIQYTYLGMPLYYFVDDKQGQVTGNGDENFHVAKPAASTTSQSNTTPASPAPTPSTSDSTSGYYQ